MKSLMKWIFLGVSMTLSASSFGQLAQNLTIGNAKALALANAVTADPPGIDAIHFNPAGLTRLKGRQRNLKIVAGQFTIASEIERTDFINDVIDQYGLEETIEEGEAIAGTVSVMLPFFGLTELPVLLAPLGGISISSPDNRLTFADAVYAPMIVGFTREEESNARYHGNALGFTHLSYFTPSLGFKVTDTLSVGAGIIFSYTGVGLDLDMRVPLPILAALDTLNNSCETDDAGLAANVFINLCDGNIGPFDSIGNLYLEVEEGFNPSINIGFLWEPVPWFSWGAVYQSEAKAKLKGEFEFTYEEKWVDFFQGLGSPDTVAGFFVAGLPIPKGVPVDEGGATLDFTIPAHFSTGISLQVLPRIKVNVDAKWTDTAAWEEFKIEFDTDVDFLAILSLLDKEHVSARSITFPRGYESTWSWALGVEYEWSDRLALRAGYEDRPSAIPTDKADLLAPFGAAYLVGFGFSYQWDKDTLMDVGVGMLQSDVDIPSGSSSNVNSEDPSDLIYNPYAGYDVTTSVTAYLFEMSFLTHF